MPKKSIFISIVLFNIVFIACTKEEQPPSDISSEDSPVIESSIPIASSIIAQADQYVRSQVGEEFFATYISFNEESSQYYPPDEYCVENPNECSLYLQEPNYLMVYSLKIPEKPYMDGIIEFALDEEGDLITEREAFGIPNCIETPTECEFPIDEARVIKIAEQAGLEEGIKEWNTGTVHWYGGELKTYVWTISNTLTEGEGGTGTGQTVIIDANSGEVLGDIVNWMRES